MAYDPNFRLPMSTHVGHSAPDFRSPAADIPLSRQVATTSGHLAVLTRTSETDESGGLRIMMLLAGFRFNATYSQNSPTHLAVSLT